MRSVGVDSRLAAHRSGRGVASRLVPLGLDGLGFRYGDDRSYASAVAGHVGDPAADGGLVQDIGQRGPQFTDPDLDTCGRRHTPIVAEVRKGTSVYTTRVGWTCAKAAPDQQKKPP